MQLYRFFRKIGSGRKQYALLPVVTIGCCLLFFSWSCSTHKTGFVSRNYHNVTAHYNGFYNARIKVAEGAEKLASTQKDQYDRVLPLSKYGTAAQAKSIYPQMDDAMKRTSVVIHRHTLKDKHDNELPDKEKWIDDNWNVYGQALFYKHEYFEAIEIFKFVEATYKKEQGRHIASMWLVRTYLQLTQLQEAEDKLDYLRNQKDMTKETKGEYELVAADFYLQTKNYPKTIEHLSLAIPYAKTRDARIRYMFILAQLYQQQGDFKKAFNYYTQVIKKNPEYEMAFNARINRARCFDAQSTNSHKVKEELLKMAKDPKNKEFLDQVYFALAGISQKEGNEEEEINYLHKSVQTSTSNQTQKGLSYLELGKIYLAKPDYRKAQAYYDSCVSSLDHEHPSFNDILTIRNSLTKLIKYLKTIETEDSLQTLARLSPADREKAAEDVLKKEEEEKKKKEEEEKEQQVNQIFNPNDAQKANDLNKGSGSSWYFYNVQAIAFGLNEFLKKWGNRKLEDNWRRSTKQNIIAEEEVAEKKQEDTVKKDPKEIREARKKEMLAKIPASQEAIDKSTMKVVDAYYNAGMLYNEQLNDKNAAAKMFEDLLTKYPKNKYELPVYYQLYRIYLALGNTAKSDHYKNILLDQYPESDYAMIIKNPNYMAEKAAKKSDLEVFYEDTYRKYLNGEYAEVIKRKQQSDQMYPGNPLVPKFDMLKTLAVGRTQPMSTFTASLQDIVRNYSTDPVREQAQNILDYINGLKGADENKMPVKDTTAKLYNYFPDTAHYIVISFRNVGPINSDKLKIKLADYNTKYYSTKGYQVSSQLFDHLTQIIVIKEFSNKEEVMLYNNGLNDNDEVYGNTDPQLYNQFVISTNNFPTYLKEKKLEDYLDFYMHFYK